MHVYGLQSTVYTTLLFTQFVWLYFLLLLPVWILWLKIHFLASSRFWLSSCVVVWNLICTWLALFLLVNKICKGNFDAVVWWYYVKIWNIEYEKRREKADIERMKKELEFMHQTWKKEQKYEYKYKYQYEYRIWMMNESVLELLILFFFVWLWTALDRSRSQFI